MVDTFIPTRRLKENFDRTNYANGVECWLIRKQHIHAKNECIRDENVGMDLYMTGKESEMNEYA